MEDKVILRCLERMNPISAEDLQKKYAKETEERFCEHQVRPCDSGWRFQRSNKSMHMGEVLLLSYGNVLVHGDVSPLLFSGSVGPKRARLEWLADSEPDYLAKKVKLGKPTCFVGDVAFYELQLCHREETSQPHRRLLRNAMVALAEGGEESMREELMPPGDCEIRFKTEFYSLGQTISPDIFAAIAIAKRVKACVEELDEWANDH